MAHYQQFGGFSDEPKIQWILFTFKYFEFWRVFESAKTCQFDNNFQWFEFWRFFLFSLIYPNTPLIFGGIFDLFAKTPFEHLNFGGSELKLFLIFIATLITTGLVTMGTTSQNLHRPHKCHLAAVCNKTTFPPPTGSPNNKACQLWGPRPTGNHPPVPPEILVPRSPHPTENPRPPALSDPHITAHPPPTGPPTWVDTPREAHWGVPGGIIQGGFHNITVYPTDSNNKRTPITRPRPPLITRPHLHHHLRLIFLSSWTSWQHNNPRFKINTPIWNR